MMVVSPRSIVRKALVRLLQDKKSPVYPLLQGRVFPNREEHWEEDMLPACGVYTLTEDTVESDISPNPEMRELTLRIEILARHNKDFDSLDDVLDSLAFGVERTLFFEGLCDAVAEVIHEAKKEAAGLCAVVPYALTDADYIHDLTCEGVSFGFAEDGQRTLGVAALDYIVSYAARDFGESSTLPDFLHGVTGWDVAGSDPTIMDAEDWVEFEPMNK